MSLSVDKVNRVTFRGVKNFYYLVKKKERKDEKYQKISQMPF